MRIDINEIKCDNKQNPGICTACLSLVSVASKWILNNKDTLSLRFSEYQLLTCQAWVQLPLLLQPRSEDQVDRYISNKPGMGKVVSKAGASRIPLMHSVPLLVVHK